MRFLVAILWVALLALPARAETEFTIGTGSAGFTYAPVAEIIAGVMAGRGIAVRTVPSQGSLDNIEAIAGGQNRSGFAQSDVAYWAYQGNGVWSGNPAVEGLRTIAALYQEHIHIVTLEGREINSLDDLRGKRISLDKVGSGTHVEARLILEAAGFRSDEYGVADLSGEEAAQALINGEIAAFFVVAGYPVRLVEDLAKTHAIRLVPIEGEVSEELIWRHGFLLRSDIPNGIYPDVPGVSTVSVGAHWFTSDAVPEDEVYRVTEALFSPEMRDALVAGHPKGAEMTAETALDGVAVPLHPGAVRYYVDSGVMD